MSDPRPPTLDYATPTESKPQSPAQFILAMILSGGFVLGGLPVSFLVSYNTQSNSPMYAFIGICLAMFAVPLALRRTERWRGYAAGIWVGLTIAGLIEGACFLSMR